MARYALHIQYAGRPPETKAFDKDVIIVGRDAGDIAMFDPQVSGRHAEIRYSAGKLIFRDLGSTNGSFLATGERLQGPVELSVGHSIRVGQSMLTVQHIEQPAAAAPARTMFAHPGMARPAPGGPPQALGGGYPAPAPPAAPGYAGGGYGAQAGYSPAGGYGGAPGYPGNPPPAAPAGYGGAPSYGGAPGYPGVGGYPSGAVQQPPPHPNPAYPPPAGGQQGGYTGGYAGGGPPNPPSSGYPVPGGYAPPQPGYPPPGAAAPASTYSGQRAQPSTGPGYPGVAAAPVGSAAYGQAPPPLSASAPGLPPPPPPPTGAPFQASPSPAHAAAPTAGLALVGDTLAKLDELRSTPSVKADVLYGIGLLRANLIPTVMVMGLPLVGAAVLAAPFTILNLTSVASLVSSLGSLASLLAFPALVCFMARAHIGTSIGWRESYKVALDRGVPDLVSFWVASLIGAVALFFPLGFFVAPIWRFEERKFVEINKRSFALWKPVIGRTILSTIILAVIVMLPISILSSVLFAILGGVEFLGRVVAAVAAILSALGSAAVTPMVLAVAIKIYFEVRTQIDGDGSHSGVGTGGGSPGALGAG